MSRPIQHYMLPHISHCHPLQSPRDMGVTAGVWLPSRNCRGNPNCLVGIGEHVWLGEIDENSFHNIDDPNCERRKKVPPNPTRGAQEGRWI